MWLMICICCSIGNFFAQDVTNWPMLYATELSVFTFERYVEIVHKASPTCAFSSSFCTGSFFFLELCAANDPGLDFLFITRRDASSSSHEIIGSDDKQDGFKDDWVPDEEDWGLSSALFTQRSLSSCKMVPFSPTYSLPNVTSNTSAAADHCSIKR